MEKSYTNKEDDKPVIKSDLIYRFLIEENNLESFQKQVNIFKWNGQKDFIEEINIADYLTEFLIFKTQYDINEMTKILSLKEENNTTKKLRKEMNYSNNRLRMLLGYLDQLNGKGRNSFIMQNYYKIEF